MTPIMRAAQVYQDHPTTRDFLPDVVHHLVHGYVISTPEIFLAFRGVDSSAHPDQICDPSVTFHRVDCWHVWIAAGNWPAMLARHLPYRTRWISWERQFRLRFWPLEKLLAKAGAVSLSKVHGERWQQGSNGRIEEGATADERF